MNKKMKFIIYLLYLLMPAIAFSQSDAEITRIINKHRPLMGYTVPEDVAQRLGTTHTGGKYFFTKEPFLIEGAKKIEALGFGIAKFFVGGENHYPYNSNWNMAANSAPVDFVRHPYFQEALKQNFSTIILNVTNLKKELEDDNPNFTKAYKEIYDLAKYLLTKYKDRKVDFVIKNWEGDWLLRGGFLKKEDWLAIDAKTKERRMANMIQWFQYRQNAIEKARKEAGNTTCKIYHAVECNKVMEAMKGTAGLASDVLPKIKADMVSWSCYDGLSKPVNLYKGIQYLQKQLQPSDYMQGKTLVMLGEIGIPEQIQPDNITTRWDEFMGVCFALNVPYIVHWELYCNEPVDGDKKRFLPPRTANELKGFWLIKPDGSDSEALIYFKKLLNNKKEISPHSLSVRSSK